MRGAISRHKFARRGGELYRPKGGLSVSDHRATTRRSFLRTTAVATGFVALACIQTGYAQSPKRDVTMRLDWLFQGPNSGFMVAKDKGYYAEAGLNVDIGPGRGSGSTAQLVASKAAMFGFSDGYVVGNSVAKDLSITMVASIYRRNPTAVVVLEDDDRGRIAAIDRRHHRDAQILGDAVADHVSIRESEHGRLAGDKLRRASGSAPRSDVDVETGFGVVALVFRDHEAGIGALEKPVETHGDVSLWRLRVSGLYARKSHETGGNGGRPKERSSRGGSMIGHAQSSLGSIKLCAAARELMPRYGSAHSISMPWQCYQERVHTYNERLVVDAA